MTTRTTMVLALVALALLAAGCESPLTDDPASGGDSPPVDPTRMLYTGGYLPTIYEVGFATGGNDVEIAGFDRHVFKVWHSGSDFVYVGHDESGYGVYERSDGVDLEIPGFEYLSSDSTIHYVDSTWYYTVHSDTPGLGLYTMDPNGTDTIVSGCDNALGTNSNGPYFYHDGVGWYYTVNPTDGSDPGVFRLVEAELSDDIEITGFDDTGSLRMSAQPIGTTIEYSDGGRWYTLDDSGIDPVIEGFDVPPNAVVSDGTDRYYVLDGSVYTAVDGPTDDTALTSLDASSEARFVFSDGASIHAGVSTDTGYMVARITDGADERVLGVDDPYCYSAAWDGTQLYYSAYVAADGGRFVYKVNGTEESDGTDDELLTGVDSALQWPAYSFAVVGGEVLYPGSGCIMRVAGTEANGTGHNDEIHVMLDTSE